MSGTDSKTASPFGFDELMAKYASEPYLAPSKHEEPPWAPKFDRNVVANLRRVPERHLQNVFDKQPDECTAFQHVQAFLEDRKAHMLLLLGVPGTQKSGSACWALTQRPGLYVAGRELSRVAISKMTDDQELFRNLFKTGLLVFDDLGMEYCDDKGWIISVIDGLVEARYSACLKTIFTSNLSTAEFKAKYGERFADRIRECGKVVTLGGESVRIELGR